MLMEAPISIVNFFVFRILETEYSTCLSDCNAENFCRKLHSYDEIAPSLVDIATTSFRVIAKQFFNYQ